MLRIELRVVPQDSDAFDFDLNGIAIRHGTDAFGSTGDNQVAGIERHHVVHERDQLRNRENHIAAVGGLAHFAIQPGRHIQGKVVQTGNEIGPDRAEGVESFPPRPLDIFLLKVAGGNIVDAGNAEDIFNYLRGRELTASLGNDDADFAFLVDALAGKRHANRILGTNACRQRLHECDRFFGN